MRVQNEAKLDALLAGASKTKRAGFFNQLRKTFDAFLGFSARNEIAQSTDDLACAYRLFGGSVQRVFDFRAAGIGSRSQKAARTFHVVAYRGQRLVEFMCQR